MAAKKKPSKLAKKPAKKPSKLAKKPAKKPNKFFCQGCGATITVNLAKIDKSGQTSDVACPKCGRAILVAPRKSSGGGK